MLKNEFKVIKRDGREVDFELSKIADAIFKAVKAVGGTDYARSCEIAKMVAESLTFENGVENIETIQDMVEKILIEQGHAKVAKAYILYREKRNKERLARTTHRETMRKLTFESAADNNVKRENANIDGNTAMGTMLKYGSEAAKAFYEDEVLPEEYATAHREGAIHIHDLDFYTLTMTCCQIDGVKIMKNGFSTGHGYLREPNSIGSYQALMSIAIQANQNDQHGGQSVPNFDYAMAIGVRKTYKKRFKEALQIAFEDWADAEDASLLIENVFADNTIDINMGNTGEEILNFITYFASKAGQKMSSIERLVFKARTRALKSTDKETHQAMEAFVHNLNTMHSRAGAQTPFSSINYGTDTSLEGRMVIKNILLATEEGLGHGETPIFPIHIFKVKEGVNYNPGEPNYDLFKLACRVSAKRLFPNFSFVDAPYNLQYYKEGNPDTEVAYMGCRTRVIGNIYDPSREVVGGRGNLSFTSLNLPRLAIESKGDIDLFFKMLGEKMELCIGQLNERFRIQSEKTVRNFPFLMGQGVWLDSEKLGPDDKVGEVIKHGTLSVGFIGLAETLTALIGCHHGESEEAQTLGLRIIKAMRSRLDEESGKTGLNYSLLATPAEGLSGRFVKLDKKKYGVIKGVTDKEYYTNSFHIPVAFGINAFDKIKLEAPYHALTNAGHISYIELDGDPCGNLEAFEAVVRCMKESGIGYGSINHPVDRCPVCGYTGIIGNECPACHAVEGRIAHLGDCDNSKTIIVKFDRIRRITGYLTGNLEGWNNAKREEEKDRRTHSLTSDIERI